MDTVVSESESEQISDSTFVKYAFCGQQSNRIIIRDPEGDLTGVYEGAQIKSITISTTFSLSISV